MKKLLSTTIIAAIIFTFAGCEQFITSYERIDASEFRLIGVTYEPADIAPGDTVTLTAVFAGKNIEDIGEFLDWWVSFNVIRDPMGSGETLIDSTRLDLIAESSYNYGTGPLSPTPRNTQIVKYRFQVPEDIVRRSASVPDNWTNMFPEALVNRFADYEVISMTKNELVAEIIKFTEDDASSILGDPDTPELSDFELSLLFQILTVPFTVKIRMKEPGQLPHTIRSSHSTRYNNRFTGLGVPINTNPIISDVVVYKVKGNLHNLNNRSGAEYEIIRLDNTGNSEIVVENGYSYFLDAHTSNIDRTITITDLRVEENHRIFVQFQHDSEETKNINHTKFMEIDNGTGKITPPSDKNITKFTFFVNVTDESANERMRPRGSAIAEVSGRFVYR